MPPCLSERLVSLVASSLSDNQVCTLYEGFKLEGKNKKKANQGVIDKLH